MKKIDLKKLIIISILMALSALLKTMPSTPEFRISIFEIPLVIAGIVGGIGLGAIAGLGADLIYGFIFNSFPFAPIMTLSCVVWGLLSGILHKKQFKLWQLVILVTITSLLATTINSIQLYIYYQGGMWAGLPLRLFIMTIKIPIIVAVVWLVEKRVIEPWEI